MRCASLFLWWIYCAILRRAEASLARVRLCTLLSRSLCASCLACIFTTKLAVDILRSTASLCGFSCSCTSMYTPVEKPTRFLSCLHLHHKICGGYTAQYCVVLRFSLLAYVYVRSLRKRLTFLALPVSTPPTRSDRCWCFSMYFFLFCVFFTS